MATFQVISETGFPHAACCVNGVDWYGFKPAIPKMPICAGHLDRGDRSQFMKLSVIFRVDDRLAATEVPRITNHYARQLYAGGIHDCVSLVADLAEALGLRIPPRPNFLPDNFVVSVRGLNGGALIG